MGKILFITFLVFSGSISVASPNENDSWSQLSVDAYINKRVMCLDTINEFKWSFIEWPKESIAPKPMYQNVKNLKKLRRLVVDNMKKESALADHFGFQISNQQVQNELNRMVLQSKDPQKLEKLFDVFHHNSYDIAECVARPYLVEKIFKKMYSNDMAIHMSTKSNAFKEAKALEISEMEFVSSSQIHTIRYQLQNSEKPSTLLKTNALEQKDFDQLKLEISRKSKVDETEDGYIYKNIIDQNEQMIQIETHFWPKLKSTEWLKSQSFELNNWTLYDQKLKILEIPKIKNPFHTKSLDTGYWRSESIPLARTHHTAVWTGNEMIVWGGINGSRLNSGGRYDPVTDTWLPTSLTDAPSARNFHTAIWTGTEMIIWGGYDGSSDLNTGAKYNPVSDSWTPINSGTAPQARSYHTTVWTGQEMIIWGGYALGNLNTGGKYNPVTDTWTATSLTGAPAGRLFHTAVWTGQEMIIWSGHSSDRPNSGGLYNPQTDSWNSTDFDSAPAGRAEHTAVWTGTKMIVWGGYGTGVDNSAVIYDPGSGGWELSSTLNAPNLRAFHSAVWTGQEMIVWGGSSPIGGKYDLDTNSWTPVGTTNQPTTRNDHSAVWTGTEMIIWGGFAGSDPTSTGGRYTPDSDNWTDTSHSNVISPRKNHTAIWTGNEMIVWGGEDGILLDTGGRYDPTTGQWLNMTTTGAPIPRVYHSAIWTGTEMIIWGGKVIGDYINSGGRYNPISNEWQPTTTTNAPSGRQDNSIIWTGEEMIVWGGRTGSSPDTHQNTGSKYNPSTNSWSSINNSLSLRPRIGHSAVWTGSEMIIYGGHNNLDLNYSDGGHYNPVTDTWTALGTGGPGRRTLHAGVWSGDHMIIWGGERHDTVGGFEETLNTGSSYDPVSKSWTTISSLGALYNAPPYFSSWTGSELIYITTTQSRGQRYNPTTDSWLNLNSEGKPPTTYHRSHVWAGDKLIIFGGERSGRINNLYLYNPNYIYSINVNVSGLNFGDSVEVVLNSTNYSVNENGMTPLLEGLRSGQNYTLNLDTTSMNHNLMCELSETSGVINSSNVTIDVTCHYEYSLGVNVTGLATENEFNILNDAEVLTVNTNGITEFSDTFLNSETFNIFVLSQPESPNQVCTFDGSSSGEISSADMILDVTCETVRYMVGGNVIGLIDGTTLTVVNNDTDELLINANDSFQFIDSYFDGSSYNVSILHQPEDPYQSCTVQFGSGSIDGNNVVNINIVCELDEDLIFKSGF